MWTAEQAVYFGRSVGPDRIEYIEEPTASPTEADAFFEATGIPYALDETLLEEFELDRFRQVAAFVVKPTMFGGSADLLTLLRSDVPIVFSSSFESQVGLTSIARLAAEFSPDVAVGLDTHRWLLESFVNEWAESEDGELKISLPLQIDESRLVEVQL